MQARITETGTFEIKRAGEWLEQGCYRAASSHGIPVCGHGCPGFVEHAYPNGTAYLILQCFGIKYDIAEDLRGGKEAAGENG